MLQYMSTAKKVEVSNDGHGGSDRQFAYPQFMEEWDSHMVNLLQTLDQYCVKTFGTKKYEWGEVEIDLEHWCQDRLYDHLEQKKLKTDMRTKFICIDKVKNELYAYKKRYFRRSVSKPYEKKVTHKMFA